jgi:hypothetical protein
MVDVSSVPTQPQLHLSRQSALSAATRSFVRALAAFRSVSSAGVPHALCVANALLTLSDHARLFSQPPPAPGALAAVDDDATAALAWLRENVDRLRRALAGLDLHVENFRTDAFCSATSENRMLGRQPRNAGNAMSAAASLNEDAPILATLDGAAWGKLFSNAVQCLRCDLEDKSRFLESVDAVASGVAPIDRNAFERGAETWLEMPRVHDLTVDLVCAAYDAEVAACEELDGDAGWNAPSLQKHSANGLSGHVSTSKAAGSPAMALLLSRNIERKNKRK